MTKFSLTFTALKPPRAFILKPSSGSWVVHVGWLAALEPHCYIMVQACRSLIQSVIVIQQYPQRRKCSHGAGAQRKIREVSARKESHDGCSGQNWGEERSEQDVHRSRWVTRKKRGNKGSVCITARTCSVKNGVGVRKSAAKQYGFNHYTSCRDVVITSNMLNTIC